MILKVHKANYSQVSNDVLTNPNLSWKAKGVFAYLIGKPEHWNIVQTDLINQSKDGSTAVRTAMKELTKAGYMRLVSLQNIETGQMDGTMWELSNEPIFIGNKIKCVSWNPTTREYRDVENQRLGKSNTSNNEDEVRMKESNTEFAFDENSSSNGSPEKEKMPITFFEKEWNELLQREHQISYYADKVERFAMNQIKKKLLFQVQARQNRDGIITDKSDDEKTLEAWQYVLNNFSKWSDFDKKFTKLTQINGQISNILASIKSGGRGKKSDQVLAADAGIIALQNRK